MFESLNTTTGQCYPGAIIDVGGKAYLYTMSSPADGNPPNGNIWQIGLAVAPAPIASIVTAKEEAVSFVASDNFSSGVGSLSNNWTTPVGGHALQIIAGNLCEMGTISVVCGEAYTGVTFSNDQYSEITIQILANGQFFAPTVRNQTASVGWYGINIVGPIGSAVNSFYINKNVGGTFTQIGPSQTITLQVGDVIRLSVVGNVISAFQNGFLIQQVQDNSNTFSSGFPGLGGFTTTLVQAQVSLWAGGNAGVIPNYNPPNLYVANIVSCSPRPEANTWEVIYLYPLDAGGIGEAIVVVGPNQAIAQWPTPSSTITIPSSPGSSQQFTFPCPPIIKWGTFGIGTFGGTHGFPSYFFA